jgi:hypothetical protein
MKNTKHKNQIQIQRRVWRIAVRGNRKKCSSYSDLEGRGSGYMRGEERGGEDEQ